MFICAREDGAKLEKLFFSTLTRKGRPTWCVPSRLHCEVLLLVHLFLFRISLLFLSIVFLLLSILRKDGRENEWDMELMMKLYIGEAK